MISFNLYSKNIEYNTPLIFLDIDGVIHYPFHSDMGWIEHSIDLINQIVKETNAKIVITTYRTYYVGYHNVLLDLKMSGLNTKVIIDYINYPLKSTMKNEFIKEKNIRIGNYLLTNSLENYVVIDDYSLFDDEEDKPLKDRFIKTKPNIGFSQKDYIKAKSLLK